jgi:hypothetical protein
MKLARNIHRNEDGTVEASWKLSAEEASYLISYAIADLLDRGLATIEDNLLENAEPVGGVQ